MPDQGWPAENVIDSQDKFDAAINAFRKRVPITKDEWLKLNAFERENAFTVARVTNGRVLQDVCAAIDKAVEKGTDFKQFREDVELELIEQWGGEIPFRAETIFRTNLMTTYMEGRHAIYSSPTVKQARPYLRCDGVDDDRECEICEAFDGVIRPQEEWAETSPPFHFCCRHQLTPLSADEAEEEGIADEMPDQEIDDDFGHAPSKHGDDWDFDLSNMPPELRSMVEHSLSQDVPAEDFDTLDETPSRTSKSAEGSIGEEDYGGAVNEIVDYMRSSGYHVWAEEPLVSVTKELGEGLDDYARAVAGFDGHIKIGKHAADGATRFAKALEENKGGTLASVNRILKQRSREIDPRHWTDSTDAEMQLTKDVGGFEAIAHEAHHLSGPQGLQQLGQESIVINEVTTEMAARKYMREKVGVRYPVQNDLSVGSSCGYGDWTELMRKKIADVMGVDNETANAMLERASIHFKSHKGTLTEVWEARKLFSEAFGSKAKEIADAIHRAEFEE
jgi:hypothetical protein